MKISTLIAFACILLASCESASDKIASKEDLKNLVLDYYNSLAKKNYDKAKSLTTPDFIMYENGIIYTNESSIKEIESMSPFSVSFSLDSINAHIDKQNASAYYLRGAIFTKNDSTWAPMRFLESATFKKEGKEWKIRFIHSSSRP